MKLIASLLIAAALVAPALTAQAAEPAKVAKPDLAKGEASYAGVCAACHGAPTQAIQSRELIKVASCLAHDYFLHATCFALELFVVVCMMRPCTRR